MKGGKTFAKVKTSLHCTVHLHFLETQQPMYRISIKTILYYTCDNSLLSSAHREHFGGMSLHTKNVFTPGFRLWLLIKKSVKENLRQVNQYLCKCLKELSNLISQVLSAPL